MSIPSNDEILKLLDQLDLGKCADDLETEWLDFKGYNDAKEEKRLATEYAVCFANAEGGVVVFGVDDKARGGRAKAIKGTKSVQHDQWKKDIFQNTTPHLEVEIEELIVAEGRLVVLRVQKGTSPPYGTSGGVFKQRVGKNCMPMDFRAEALRQVSTGAVDWSGQPAQGVNIADLDQIELARARNVLRALKPNSGLLQANDQELLRGLGAMHDGQVTRAGLLLFGRPDTLQRHCPQHVVQYVYQASQLKVTRNDVMSSGLLNIQEQIERAFTGPANPEEELSIGLLKLRIPTFPVDDTVREAVLNAVTHRDYTDPGKVLVRHSATELVVSSPGGFIAGITPQNILRHESRTRNQKLALAFVKLGLAESAGMGRKRIFIPMLSYGKRPPVYETDGHSVTLKVFGGGFDARLAKLVAKWRQDGREIDLDALLILSHMREHAFIDTYSATELLQLSRGEVRGLLDKYAQPETGLLERRGRTAAATFHLTKAIAKDLLGKAAYTKTRGINPIRYAEMVRMYVTDHGSITPAECRELLGLGESDSDKVTVSKLLRRWSSEAGFLIREGSSHRTRYWARS